VNTSKPNTILGIQENLILFPLQNQGSNFYLKGGLTIEIVGKINFLKKKHHNGVRKVGLNMLE